MSTTTSIEWTQKTWNPLVGCTKVSPGCLHCYAETMAKRLRAMALAEITAGKDPGRKRHYIDAVDDRGRWTGKLIPVPEALPDPFGWRKPARVFVNSMSDLFHKDVPFDFIDRVFAVMALCPQHTFQVLTKRPERMAEYLAHKNRSTIIDYQATLLWRERNNEAGCPWTRDFSRLPAVQLPLPNVWLGCSVENQEQADARIPHLLKCPAAVRFLSCEPLLGPVVLPEDARACEHCGKGYESVVVDFGDSTEEFCRECMELNPDAMSTVNGYYLGDDSAHIDWVIVGGESGHGARPCNVRWVRDIVAQCKAAGVPVFVKQLGSNPIFAKWDVMYERNIRDPKGGDMSEWPEDLRVRELPQIGGGV